MIYFLDSIQTLCLNCNYNSIIYEFFIALKLELLDNNLLECLKYHLSWENNIIYKYDKCNEQNKSKKILLYINYLKY